MHWEVKACWYASNKRWKCASTSTFSCDPYSLYARSSSRWYTTPQKGAMHDEA